MFAISLRQAIDYARLAAELSVNQIGHLAHAGLKHGRLAANLVENIRPIERGLEQNAPFNVEYSLHVIYDRLSGGRGQAQNANVREKAFHHIQEFVVWSKIVTKR